MLTLSLIAASLVSVLSSQPASPAPAPACALLTPPEVAAIIGTARPLTVTNAGTGSTCMFQNADKIITVLMNKLATADAAKNQWEAKKRVSAGKDIAGWPTPAYVGIVDSAKDHVAIVGLVSSLTFVEVKAIDKTQPTADLTAKTQASMKALSGRLATQK